MSTEDDLQGLYPFLHGKQQDAAALDAALLQSVAEKARDSRETNERFFGELPNREIALALGLDERTVASHLCRALDDLERLLTQPDLQEEIPHAFEP